MFSIKTVIFASLFAICTIGAIFLPHLGVYGYLADYCIGPGRQWWEAPISSFGIRYSFSLAFATIIGFILQRQKLRFGYSIMQRNEILLLLFLGLIWFSFISSSTTLSRYDTIDHPALKYTKIVVFILLMTHIVTDRNKLNGLLWIFVLCALVLGLQAWDLPRRAFVQGRLEGIGGADFSESNFLASFMAAMLPIIGVQLLRAKKWIHRIVCFFSAAFTANTVVLCRSRGALVGIVMGCSAAIALAPKRHRKKIAIGLVLGSIGGLYVTDEQFLERMTTIIVSDEVERDESAASRFRLWQAGLQMVADKPLGIGIGNWYQTIGGYIPEYEGKDSHNTFIKCLAELGYQGGILFALIIFFSLKEVLRVRTQSEHLPPDMSNDFIIMSFGIFLSIVVILTCGLTITMIYTEVIWILIMLPVCLRRAFENAIFDNEHAGK